MANTSTLQTPEPKGKPPIVLVAHDGKLNGKGVDLVVEKQLRALNAFGVQAVCIARSAPRGLVNALTNVQFKPMRFSPAKIFSNTPSLMYAGARRRWLTLCAKKQLLRLKKNYPGRDIILLTWGGMAWKLFPFAKKIGGVRCILNQGNRYGTYPNPSAEKATWPVIAKQPLMQESLLAHAVLVCSAYAKQTYIEAGVAASRVHNISRGVNFSAFARPEKQTAAKVPFTFVVVGRVCQRKGVHQTVAAFKAAAFKPSAAQLLFLGDIDGSVKSFTQAVQSKGSADYVPGVRFLGAVPYPHGVAKILHTAHAQVLLSNDEGLAKAVLEGAACSLPAILTPQVGLPIENGTHGFMVQRKDTAAHARAKRTLFENPQEAARMGAALRQHVTQHYTWEAFTQNFIKAVLG